MWPRSPGVAAGPYTADGLPPGLTFNPTTGRISGTPTVPGTFPIALSATNGAGTGTGTLTLAITGGNAADEAYAFTTLAGAAGSDGSTNGTGAAARFWNPSGVAVDKAGNVFVADSSNSLIRRISGGGIVTTFAGSPGQPGSANGTGAAARFRIPHAIAVDRSGNLYVTDYGNQTIRKLTPAGVVTTIAGGVGIEGSTDGPGSAARFRYPIGLAVDAAGIVYVADTENHTIRRISLAGEVTTFAGAAGSAGSTDGARSAARFNFPSGIAVDASGNLYVSDASNHTIRKITPLRSRVHVRGHGREFRVHRRDGDQRALPGPPGHCSRRGRQPFRR
jgi:sugar lactone lactonase YvrE